MPKIKLTHSVVQSRTTTKRQEDFWDTETRVKRAQFGLRVFATGKKVFIARYRTKDGRKPQCNIGDAACISLSDARAKFKDIIAETDGGLDPALQREVYKKSRTFTDLSEEFIAYKEAMIKSDRMRQRTVAEYARVLRVDIQPKIGAFRLPDVTKKHILAILDEIGGTRNSPAQARRTQAILHNVFRYALERDYLSFSPCIGLPRQKEIRPRTRVLSDEEIRALWEETKNASSMTALILRLTLLLGQRPGEVAGMRQSEIKDNVWTIPASRTKNKRAQVVPLPNFAIELLEKHRVLLKEAWKNALMLGQPVNRDIVFFSRNGDSIAYIGKSCGRIRRRAKLERFSPHDLRRTCATRLGMLGISGEVIAKVLNHTPSSVTGRHYNHYDGFKEKKDALDRWADTIRGLTSGQTSSSETSSGVPAAGAA